MIQPEKSTPSPIFFGPDGLRAGWALLVATTICFALYYAIGFILRLAHLAPHEQASPTPGTVLYSEGVLFLIVAATSWIMSRIENRPASTYGLGGHRRRLSRFAAGTLWGLLFLSVLVFVLIKSGLLVIDARLLTGSDILRYALAWAPAFLAIALFEEYLFRGYLLFTLTRGLAGLYRRISPSRGAALGFWTAALLLSFGFGLVHGSNADESPIGLFSAGLISLVFCLSLWRTGSLWWAIGFHAAWDWAESYLYGVADSGITVRFHLLATHPTGSPLLSGGATGPEGSLFVIPIAALTALVILLTLRDKEAYAALLPSFNASLPGTGSLPDPVPAPPFEEHRR